MDGVHRFTDCHYKLYVACCIKLVHCVCISVQHLVYCCGSWQHTACLRIPELT